MRGSAASEFGLQDIKKFPAFYGTKRFIIVLIRTTHPSPSWARWIQSTTSKKYFSKIDFNIILSSIPRTSEFPLSSRLSNKNFALLSCYVLWKLHAPPPPTSFLITKFSPRPCHVVTLRFKYTSQDIDLNVFCSLNLKDCFTFIQNNMQNYSSAQFDHNCH
jgi:hypothetical protein